MIKDLYKSYQDLLDEKWKGRMAWPLLSAIGAPLFVTNLRLAWGEDKAMARTDRYSAAARICWPSLERRKSISSAAAWG
jgi:ABC-type Fe3+ transport system substrate-binding protein